MGAETFMTRGRGKTAQLAFRAALDQALYEHGHGGYSGTLAEKDSFVMIGAPAGVDVHRFAQDLIDADDPRIEDKWGPAGCVKVSEDAEGVGTYLFFGWASS